MKSFKICLAACFFLLTLSISDVKSQPEKSNFFTIQSEMQEKLAEAKKSAAAEFQSGEREFDSETEKFKRWEWYWRDRVLPDGSFPDMRKQFEVYTGNKSQMKGTTETSMQEWTCINQKSCTGGYNGMGRAGAIAFHPTDPDLFYVGAPIGGIWKTTDGGKSYEALGDDLPYLGVGTIAINHKDPDVLYISISDSQGWWNYSLGVYKSVDGGETWNPGGLNWEFTESAAIYCMEMSQYYPDILLVASTKGLYKTIDGGINWELKRTGAWNDVKFHPYNPQIVYAVKDDYWGSSQVYRSYDKGETWTQVSNFTFTNNAIKLAVTPANPDMLAVIHSTNNKIYVSKDRGSTFTYKSDGEASGFITISPFNEDILYHGFVDPFQSTDGGETWNKISMWYGGTGLPEVHADQRYVRYNPVNEKIYFCNDGGVYSYDEKGNAWEELTDGLIITQYYRMANSQTDPVVMIGGTQDNGGRKRNSDGSWTATNGGDAMEVAIDPFNHDIFFTTYINGQLYRTMDGWKTNTKISDNLPAGWSGAWVTPYVIDPVNPNVLVAGYNKVYRSTNRGDSWTALSGYLAGASDRTLECIAVAPSNTDVIYASRDRSLYVTKNLGVSWTTRQVPFTENRITSIAIHPLNEDIIWVSSSGYSSNNKVFRSTNGGVTWENISGNLPNVPANIVTIDSTRANNPLYLGTDAGVYFRDDLLAAWNYYGEGLPNTSVTDIEFQYQSGKIRISTHGRGIWETTMYGYELNANPEVSLVLPVSNTQVGNGESITISAEASDADGEIQKVVFYNNAVKIAELREAPYTITLNSVQAGEYSMSAMAIDDRGNVGESETVNIEVSCPQDGPLTGPVIGTDGSWSNLGNTKYKVFDGDINTFFDSQEGNNSWAGLDLGEASIIQGIRFYPRASFPDRMTSGVFQASNSADFSQNIVTLHTIEGSPKVEWNCINISDETEYRYVRYLSPDNGYGNIAEMEVYSGLRVTVFSPAGDALLQVFPNPFDHSVTVENLPENASLTLSSVTGMLIPFELTRSSSGAIIDMAQDYPPGIYFLSVQDGRSVTLVKLLKR